MNSVSKFCLIGIPDHYTVFAVGGRVGASRGPKAFDQMFDRLKGQAPIPAHLERRDTVTGITKDVAATHRLAADKIRDAHKIAAATVVVGGSHDHGYSQLLGIKEATGARIGCINIDAHLDVRKPAPLITSGSPFYLALEGGVIESSDFIEFGIQSHCNAPELWSYIQTKSVKTIGFEELRNGRAIARFEDALKQLTTTCDLIVLSLDLDAAAAAFAPGVSAPQAEGFTSSEMIQFCELAGANKKVKSLGIFELNPEHDIDGITARLAATCAYHFIESSLKSGCLNSG